MHRVIQSYILPQSEIDSRPSMHPLCMYTQLGTGIIRVHTHVRWSSLLKTPEFTYCVTAATTIAIRISKIHAVGATLREPSSAFGRALSTDTYCNSRLIVRRALYQMDLVSVHSSHQARTLLALLL